VEEGMHVVKKANAHKHKQWEENVKVINAE